MVTKIKSNGDGSTKVLSHNLTDTATAATATPKKKKTEIVKPEKVLRENLAEQKKIYESEDWWFTENPTAQHFERWTATNGSPAFPKLQGETLSQLFSRIEELKSENGERLRRFMENQRAVFDAGKLPDEWEAKKSELEQNGWQFDYDAEKSEWSAVHAEFLGVTGVSDFGRLLRIVEKNSNQKQGFRDSVHELKTGELWATSDETNPNYIEDGKLFAPLHNKPVAEEKSDVPSQAELHRRAVKIAHYQDHIKQVIIGFDNVNRVMAELEAKFGDDWYDAFDRLIPAEFRNAIKSLWLGDCDGDEDSLTDDYKSRKVEAVIEPVSIEEEIQKRLENVTIAYATNLKNIVVSPFEGQKRRRARFTEEEISELADSIKAQGVLQPIVVRVKSIGEYEIIAGERRFLAAKKAGLETILTVIKNVSDQVAFDIQTIENLQRKDPDPIDEAFSFQEYIEKYNFTPEDLSVKFGKPLKFIAGRLKLTNLIPEALDDIAKGFLPLGHAAVISKFDADVQKEILDDYLYESPDKEDGAVTLQNLREQIQDEITLLLSEAIFDKEATNLRPDGLACINCPQRTGFFPTLFADDLDAGDRCLNKSCFELKTTNFMLQRRGEIAASAVPPVQPEEVLLIAEHYHWNDTEFGKEKVLTYVKALDAGSCNSLKPAIYVDSKKKGQGTFVCQNKKCSVHSSSASNTSSGNQAPPDYELRSSERSLNRQIDYAVQQEAVAAASRKFTRFEDLFSNGEMMRELLLNFLTTTSSWTSERIRSVFKDIKDLPTNYYDSNRAMNREFFKNLSDEDVSRMLFVCSLLENLVGKDYGDTKIDFVRNLIASHTDLDFNLLEAEKRVELAPKEFKGTAEAYRNALKNGATVEKPWFWIDLTTTPDADDDDDDDENFEYDDDDELDENDLGETTQG